MLSYHYKETILFSLYPYYGNLHKFLNKNPVSSRFSVMSKSSNGNSSMSSSTLTVSSMGDGPLQARFLHQPSTQTQCWQRAGTSRKEFFLALNLGFAWPKAVGTPMQYLLQRQSKSAGHAVISSTSASNSRELVPFAKEHSQTCQAPERRRQRVKPRFGLGS